MPLSLDGTGSISGISTFSFSDEIIHTGDTNTAIKFPANDTVSIDTSGSERLRILSDGKIGIGVVSPSHIVHIQNATTPRLVVEDTTNNVQAQIGADNTEARIGTVSNHPVSFRINDSERLRIASDGDVGIGTNSPVERLHVHKASATGPFMYITNTSTGVSASDGIQMGFDGNNSAVLKNNENTDWIFYTNGSDRFRIKSDGKVGIGTDTPFNPLDVLGSSADILIYDTDAYSENSSGAALSLQGNDSAGNRKTLADVRGVANGANIGEFAIRTRRSGGTLTEALRITSDGSTQINSGVLQRRYESSNTAGYRYYSKADRFQIAHGGSGTNLTITGMNQGWASIRFGGYTEGNRVNFRADIGGYNAGNAGVRLYDSNEITNQATAYAGGASCSITVTKNNASYVVNITQSNAQNATMASFYHFETGGYNSVSTLTIS